MIAGFIDFEFDLPGALLTKLVEIFGGVAAAGLTEENTGNIPDAQGVYQLFLDGELVYIGKTDAEAGLRKRLQRHCRKIQQRIGLDPNRVSFKAVRIYVFTAIDLETQLINHYGGYDVVTWNGSGFGSNDVGRERDTTRYKPEHFDSKFPIDIDLPLNLLLPAEGTASFILSAVKQHIPYTLRFQRVSPRSRKPHPDLEDTLVTLDADIPATVRTIVQQVVSQLPTGWQATMLPSHLILYKEDEEYVSGVILQRSG